MRREGAAHYSPSLLLLLLAATDARNRVREREQKGLFLPPPLVGAKGFFWAEWREEK